MTTYTATIELELTRTDDDLRPMSIKEASGKAINIANRATAENPDVTQAIVTNVERTDDWGEDEDQ